MFRTLALLGLLATMVFATPSSAQSGDERQNVDKIGSSTFQVDLNISPSGAAIK
jgi:hypothetical protein